MARLVQVVLTDQIAELTAAALRDASNSEDVTTDEAGILYDASRLFMEASERPEAFPLTGAKATRLQRQVRARGPAQPQSRRNKRKARQEKRQGWAKIRRKHRREMAENYNEAVRIMEAEAEEMEMAYAEQQAKLNDQPKFDVFALDGTRILGGVPESMIRPAPDEADKNDEAKPEVILP